MATRAITNLEYMVGEDSSSTFESPIVDLTLPHKALNYQLKWDVGVKGKFTWMTTIFPNEWETLVSCEEVSYTVDGSEPSTIIALPNTWLNSGFLKFVWVPDSVSGSTGNIDVAIRIATT